MRLLSTFLIYHLHLAVRARGNRRAWKRTSGAAPLAPLMTGGATLLHTSIESNFRILANAGSGVTSMTILAIAALARKRKQASNSPPIPLTTA